ncbi:MAG: polyribonucleotide nucleotidyltransferase, partial [Candidatus Izemoplasmatales bacterium]|nr:polyribonucleotide nucleotidyltransferase [Candidatus Izemoplasmatales bacterium]
MKRVFKKEFYRTEIIVEVGQLAKQATGACLVRYGETAVLSATVVSKEAMAQDFFPLMVIYQEKLYSAGKIPGGFLRREGRPTEHETLISRAIDRPLRPLFAEGFRNEVQVINTVLSADPNKSPEMTAMLGASLSLGIGGVPFDGPIAGVMVGLINGEFILNPNPEQLLESDLDLMVAGTKDAINMVEAGAKEVEEDVILDALMFAHDKIKELVAFQEEVISEIGKEKIVVELLTVPAEIEQRVRELENGRITKSVSIHEKLERQNTIEDIENEILDILEKEYKEAKLEREELEKNLSFAKQVLELIQVNEVRRLITVDKIRPDGRRTNEIRPLDSEIDL